MPISDDDISELKDILADNRRNYPSDQKQRRLVKEPTDHTRVMVPVAASSNRRRFHLYADGEPACGGSVDGQTDYRPWPKVVAMDWMQKCKFCYRHYDVERGLDEDVEMRFGEPGE